MYHHGYGRASASMEPMTLGSPPPNSPPGSRLGSHQGGSPPPGRYGMGGTTNTSDLQYAQHQHSMSPHHQQHHQSQFAPSFLLGGAGGSGASTPQPAYNRQESLPSQSPNPFGSWRAGSSDHVTFTGVNKYPDAAERRSLRGKSSSRDQFGPPTKSICFDQSASREFTNGTVFRDSISGSPSLGQSHFEFASPVMQRKPFGVGTDSLDKSVAQIDPFYTQGDVFNPAVDLDDTWITVFGFPQTAARYILDQFKQYGTMVHYEVSSKGNWMHVHYKTKIQASKALSKNSKIFDETLQIGVTPCIDREIIARYRNKPPTCDSSLGGSSSGISRTAVIGHPHKSMSVDDSLYPSMIGQLATTDDVLDQSSFSRPLTPVNQRKSLANPIRRIQSFKDPSALNNGRRGLALGSSPLATKPTSGSVAALTSPAKAGIKSLTAVYEAPCERRL